ncbi:MAG TPA: alpha/beta hydrolase-fold protein [Thermoanaerobaculia bacterium]|nr:alpha/beta hydrolase-fold protein [Thermoanaerobaculia bacterium]
MAILRASALALLTVLPLHAFAGEPVTIGETFRIRSKVLNEDRTYQVHLPASYPWAKDRRYPVLYVLDGRTHFRHMAASADFLAAEGEMPETIVVAVASTVRIRDFTQTDWKEAWVGGGGAANFKRFLSTELIPLVERTYRTDGFRTLLGHSAGGQFVLYTLTSEPALFRAYVALSPSLDWDHRLPARSLRKALESASSLSAFLYAARSDDSGQALADWDELVAALGARKVPGFRWKTEAFPEERHRSIPLVGSIHALRALYDGYRMPEGLADGGIAAVNRHYEAFSKTLGWPVAPTESAVNEVAYAELERGRTEEAIALFRRNVDAHPYSANAWDGLKDGYAKVGRWKDAAAAADRALELARASDDPQLPEFEHQARKMRDRLNEETGPPRSRE